VQCFLSTDPLASSYPELTPYQFAGNSPIANSDLDGLEPYNETLEDGSEMKLSIKLVDAPQVDAYSARQIFLFAVSSGMGIENSRAATRIIYGGGNDPITRSFSARFWSGNVTADVAGDVDFTGVTWGLDEFAGNVSIGATRAMSAALAVPALAQLGAAGGGRAAFQYLTAGSFTERVAAGTSDFAGQMLFNPVTDADYDASSTFSAIAMPNRYFLSGLGSGVNLDYESGLTFDVKQGVLGGAFNSVGGHGFGSLFDGLNQSGRALSGPMGEMLEQLPSLPLKAIETTIDHEISN